MTRAHIVVTDTQGAVRLLLRERTPITVNPITGLGQVVTTGDTAERQDQRTPQVIYTSQQGGGSQYWYTETEGIETFTDSQCDTRFPGLVALPPAATSRGTIPFILSPDPQPWSVEGIDDATPTMLAWQRYVVQNAYFYGGASWALTTGLSQGINGFARTNGKYVVGNSSGIFYSTNASAWTAGYVSPSRGVVTHDNKIFTIGPTGVLQAHTDPTATTGWTTLATSGPLTLWPGEAIHQLFEWRDGSGRTVIYCLTDQRILWLDEDADIWHHFYEFDGASAAGAVPHAHVWRRDGNLYVSFGQGTNVLASDPIVWFSGTTNLTEANRFGGLPTVGRGATVRLVAGNNWLFAWSVQLLGEPTSTGRTWAMNDQQGWHTLFVTSGATNNGGGYRRGRLWTVDTNRVAVEQFVPDATALPLFATDRTYRTGSTFYHEYGFTDLGTPNMDKQALWVTVKSLDHTSANKVPGLATGCTITVEIRRDTDTSWTSLGTLTSASTFPNVLPINSGAGLKGKQFKVRIGLASSTSTNSPMVTSVALALLRQEEPRYAYTCVVDMSDGDHEFYGNQDRAQLRERIRDWARPGRLVRLDIAGGDETTAPATATTVQNCVVQWSGQEDPDSGPGVYSLVFNDFSYPTSG